MDAVLTDERLAAYVELDRCVDGAEHDGIMARWQFGRAMLVERDEHGGKQLPHGRLDELADATGKHPRELQRRMRFGELYETEEKVRHACQTFTSWHQICADALPSGDMDVHFSSDRDDWETPQDLFDELDAEFHFEVDVCALPSSAKCATYFTPETDGLAQDWRGACWMNPPYGDEIEKWMRKAAESAAEGATVVCLVPARVDTSWWWTFCLGGEIRFLRGRLKFGGGANSAPFPSAVVVLGRPTSVVWWERGTGA